jgi:hypothetical protein
MAVAYISDADGHNTAAADAANGFVVSGTNPVIVVLIGLNSATATVSSVVCSAGLSGTATEVASVRNGTTFLSAWVVPAPSGTGTITVNFSASVDFDTNYILLQGADQTTPCPTGSENTESASGLTNPLVVTLNNVGANDATLGVGANTAGGDAPSFDGTSSVETFNNNSGNINMAAGYRLGAGSVQTTWGSTTSTDTLLAIKVAAVGGGGSVTREPGLGSVPFAGTVMQIGRHASNQIVIQKA